MEAQRLKSDLANVLKNCCSVLRSAGYSCEVVIDFEFAGLCIEQVGGEFSPEACLAEEGFPVVFLICFDCLFHRELSVRDLLKVG